MPVSAGAIAAFAAASFLGNLAFALTGFGMAIVFLFVYQLLEFIGVFACCTMKFAVLVQSACLAATAPMAVWQAGIREGARREILLGFIPGTLAGTPIGQLLQKHLTDSVVRLITGALIFLFCTWEAWRSRASLPLPARLLHIGRLATAQPASPGPAASKPGGAEAAQPKLSEVAVSVAAPAGEPEAVPPQRAVFFLIGAFCPASSWLADLVHRSTRLAAPTSPDILARWHPLLQGYGDLQVASNFELLIDHICQFVERDPSAWRDKEGRLICFDRADLLRRCRPTAARTSTKERLLVSVLEALMDVYAEQNGRDSWMCVCVDAAQFHDLLRSQFGARLHYVYLHSDPRNLTLSASLGPPSCAHPYCAAALWCSVQKACLQLQRQAPESLHRASHSELSAGQEAALGALFHFLGEPLPENLQVQLRNEQASCAGDSGDSGDVALSPCDVQLTDVLLVESMAHDLLQELGYSLAVVGVGGQEPERFSEEEVASFLVANAEGLARRAAEELAHPEEGRARLAQEAVLRLAPAPARADVAADVTLPVLEPSAAEKTDAAASAAPVANRPFRVEAKAAAMSVVMLAVGMSSGILGGLVGVQGVPLLAYFVIYNTPKAIVRANGAVILIISLVLRLGFYLVDEPPWQISPFNTESRASLHVGWFFLDHWPAILAPSALGIGGLLLGNHLNHLVSQGMFKALLSVLIAICGASMVLKSISTGLLSTAGQ